DHRGDRAEHESPRYETGEGKLEDERIGEYSDDDGWSLGHDVHEETHGLPHPILPELRHEDPRQHTHREGDQGGEGDEDKRPLDRIRDEVAHSRGQGQEVRRDRGGPPDDAFVEDAPEGEQGQRDAEQGRAAHRQVDPPSSGVSIEPSLHSAPSPTRRRRPTISRAKTLMTSDTIIRTRPSSAKALSSRPSASSHLLAIKLEIV